MNRVLAFMSRCVDRLRRLFQRKPVAPSTAPSRVPVPPPRTERRIPEITVVAAPVVIPQRKPPVVERPASAPDTARSKKREIPAPQIDAIRAVLRPHGVAVLASSEPNRGTLIDKDGLSQDVNLKSLARDLRVPHE